MPKANRPLKVVSMISGLFFVSCQLLAISGMAKVLSPSSASNAWRFLGLPSTIGFVKFVGLMELISAIVAAVLGGGSLWPLVGGWYALFTIVIFLLLRSPNSPPCGCFGTQERPASIVHLLVNALFMIVSVFAFNSEGLVSEMSSSRFGEGLYLLLIIIGAVLCYLLVISEVRILNKFRNSQ